MESCISLADVREISRRPLAHLAEMGGQLDPAKQESTVIMREEVLRTEERLKQFYQLGVVAARLSSGPAQAVEVWKAVSEFADETLAVLSTLKDKYPTCGTPELYDLALEYKSAAMKRAKLNEEATRCQTLTAPPGLFPPMPSTA